tara:strand:- start:682 stop:924 length:243 start_codon:yes stop_codon:yes gene_type:complete
MNSLKLPPKIGDRIVIGDWVQFPTTVNCVERFDDEGVVIYVTTKYPEDDPFFKVKSEGSRVYLRDEGKTWHRYAAHPKLD